MTVLKITTSSKLFNVFSLMLVVILVASSCTNKISFLTSTVVPAARGTVKIKNDSNKNHTINIALLNLAEPERLNPAKKMYMVWMETDQGATRNIGQIMTDNGTFSKTLKADFKTVTSFTPVKIFITAENDANVQSPSWEIILTTAKF
jgi:hypothetical protein